MPNYVHLWVGLKIINIIVKTPSTLPRLKERVQSQRYGTPNTTNLCSSFGKYSTCNRRVLLKDLKYRHGRGYVRYFLKKFKQASHLGGVLTGRSQLNAAGNTTCWAHPPLTRLSFLTITVDFYFLLNFRWNETRFLHQDNGSTSWGLTSQLARSASPHGKRALIPNFQIESSSGLKYIKSEEPQCTELSSSTQRMKSVVWCVVVIGLNLDKVSF